MSAPREIIREIARREDALQRAARRKAVINSNERSGATHFDSAARIYSAQELIDATFPDPRWAVPGILPEGVSILAGRPKIGKSWAGLDFAVAVACGGRALGMIEVEQGDCLFLGLEDGPRRLRDRLCSNLAGNPIPQGLFLTAQWPHLDEGGLESLDNWITHAANPRLIVIDTLKRIRPYEQRGDRLYNGDYDAIAPLGDLARKRGVSVVVIHHTRKTESDDPVDLVSGSHGLTGAADGILVLKRARGEADATLHAQGRDFEDKEIALRFDPQLTGWRILGDAAEYRLSNERRKVIELLKASEPLTPKAVSELLGREHSATKKLMWTMANDGELHADKKGQYSLTTKTLVTPVTGNPNNPTIGAQSYPVTTVTGTIEETYTSQGCELDEVLEREAIRAEGCKEEIDS